MLSTFPSTSLLYFQGKLFMCHQEDCKSPWPTLVSCKPNICKTGRQICIEGISQHIAESQSPLWDLAHHYVIESSPSWGMSSYGVQKRELWLWVLLTVSEMFLVVMALRVPVGWISFKESKDTMQCPCEHSHFPYQRITLVSASTDFKSRAFILNESLWGSHNSTPQRDFSPTIQL